MVQLQEAENIFWGITLDGDKRYSQIVDTPFHVSMAAFEPNTAGKDGCVSVMLQHEDREFLLCTLMQDVIFQQQLDLNFTEGEQLTFYLSGKGRVHLTGYLEPPAEEPDFDEFDDAESEEEESESEGSEAPELAAVEGADSSEEDGPVTPGKRKSGAEAGGKKKKVRQQLQIDSDEREEEEEDSDLLDDEAEEESDWEDDEEDEEEEGEGGEEDFADFINDDTDEQDDEEEQDMEASFEEKKKVKEPKVKNEAPPNPVVKTEIGTPGTEKKKKKKNKKKQENGLDSTPATPATAPTSPAATPDTANTTSEKKKKRKRKKSTSAQTPNAAGDSPTTQAQDKGTPAPSKKEKKGTPGKSDTPGQKGKEGTAAQKGTSPGKQTLKGGLVVEDLKPGHGPEAKPGKMTGVYYTGKLIKNNKQFDATTSGAPFKFRLGAKEVIAGWDEGIKGMKVGGKRRITVPPKLGYGNAKMGPIPPNSTLVFDVELKSVS